MVRIAGKSFWPSLSVPAEIFIRCGSFEGFELIREAIGHQEGLQMLFKVVMGRGVRLFHGSVFEHAVHALYLAIGAGMVGGRFWSAHPPAGAV
jgi:hypothetical protein